MYVFTHAHYTCITHSDHWQTISRIYIYIYIYRERERERERESGRLLAAGAGGGRVAEAAGRGLAAAVPCGRFSQSSFRPYLYSFSNILVCFVVFSLHVSSFRAYHCRRCKTLSLSLSRSLSLSLSLCAHVMCCS